MNLHWNLFPCFEIPEHHLIQAFPVAHKLVHHGVPYKVELRVLQGPFLGDFAGIHDALVMDYRYIHLVGKFG